MASPGRCHAIEPLAMLAAAPRLPGPLLDADMDGVARLLADRLAELRLDGQPVRAVALWHERAVERLAVDRAADLHQPAPAEELGRVVHHDARPRTWVVALFKPCVELSRHDNETLAYDRTHRRAGRDVKRLSAVPPASMGAPPAMSRFRMR